MKPLGTKLAILLGLVSFNLPSWATTFNVRPFPEWVSAVEVIVRGRILSIHAQRAEMRDGAERIFTYVELQVSEAFKGPKLSSTIVFRELGGEKDGLGVKIEGAAQFRTGEDVVVFLGPENSDESRDLRGMQMGKFNIVKDGDGNEILTGGSLAMETSAWYRSGTNVKNPPIKSVSLNELRLLVKSQPNQPSHDDHKETHAPSPANPSETGDPSSQASPLQTKPEGSLPVPESGVRDWRVWLAASLLFGVVFAVLGWAKIKK